jgi:hypothetical protein
MPMNADRCNRSRPVALAPPCGRVARLGAWRLGPVPEGTGRALECRGPAALGAF